MIVAEQVTAFLEDRVVARGTRDDVTRQVRDDFPHGCSDVLVFDDRTGDLVDLDYRGARRRSMPAAAEPHRGRGRPKLGVVPREVTLLPRHWDWLARQPGGASAALRRLVDAARKEPQGPEAARDAVYRFLTHMAGDRPGYEEALRALYRDEIGRFREIIAPWPKAVRRYTEALLDPLVA
jgi:uncharacterized protein